MPLTMYDSILVDTVPPNPPAVAGYVGGRWPTYAGLVARFPKAHHLSIAVNARERARCLDVEPGDATPDQAPGWYRTYAIKTEGLPVLYASASNVSAVIRAMALAGIPRSAYLIWSAHYGAGEHICGPHSCGYPQADGTQWTDTALGRNLDQSLVDDQFFGTVPANPLMNYKILTRREWIAVSSYDAARRAAKVHVSELRNLHRQLQVLAGLVWAAAHVPGGGGWDARNRGWRFQMLWRRSRGQKIA